MTDRTRHVIDAIDGALGDYTVSGDAMRWTPEPVEAQRAVEARTPAEILAEYLTAAGIDISPLPPWTGELAVTDVRSFTDRRGEWTILGTVINDPPQSIGIISDVSR